MPRKGLRPRDRRPAPAADYKFKSVLVSRLINKLDHQGKKSVAERVMYDALDIVAERTKENALDVFTRAIENIRPLLEVKARRVGGATYQVPIEVSPNRSSTLAMRWMLDAARAKSGKALAERIAEEILAANKKEGIAFKKREDTHKMAEANRAFAHYRW
ncbi:MAG TPA: 30S ribosomal protein S7 [Elusimicrobiota bacterium]|jgi:small subunit ribosomal protein S7|nr:30S ribosomal protein S7 [Elusimicrobiota bacterium]HXS99574.1 30S ribosomal protein S7 [Elusimicrobiota bacterium]